MNSRKESLMHPLLRIFKVREIVCKLTVSSTTNKIKIYLHNIQIKTAEEHTCQINEGRQVTNSFNKFYRQQIIVVILITQSV